MTTPYSVAAKSVEVSLLQARVVMAPLPATPTPTVLPSLDESRNFCWNFGNFSIVIFAAVHRHNTENLKQIFQEKRLRRPQSQFPHSCVCEWFTYSHNPSAYSAAWKFVDSSWEWKYKSLTDTWMWKLGLRPSNSYMGIYKWDFRCSVHIFANVSGLALLRKT